MGRLTTIISFHLLAVIFCITIVVLWISPKRWHGALALFLGALTGFIDLHSDEVQLTALLLLAFGFFLGFERPASAWLWAIALAGWIPIADFFRETIRLPDGPSLPGIALALPFMFSFAGSYSGVLVRRLRSPVRPPLPE